MSVVSRLHSEAHTNRYLVPAIVVWTFLPLAAPINSAELLILDWLQRSEWLQFLRTLNEATSGRSPRWASHRAVWVPKVLLFRGPLKNCTWNAI